MLLLANISVKNVSVTLWFCLQRSCKRQWLQNHRWIFEFETLFDHLL